jgi:hypothetical protein
MQSEQFLMDEEIFVAWDVVVSMRISDLFASET